MNALLLRLLLALSWRNLADDAIFVSDDPAVGIFLVPFAGAIDGDDSDLGFHDLNPVAQARTIFACMAQTRISTPEKLTTLPLWEQK